VKRKIKKINLNNIAKAVIKHGFLFIERYVIYYNIYYNIMIDTNVTHVISQQVLESTAQDMTGKYVWMFLAGLVILIFKSSIEKLAAALFMFIGNDYKEDDVVYVDGKPGRIIRVGLTKTVFFIYDIVDGKVVSGNKLVVQNERLAGLNIEKPLPNLDLSRFKKNE
jgi:hypothetical protein